MAATWYYLKGGERRGPIGSGELKALTVANQLAPDDWVWKPGLAQWIPANTVRGLFHDPNVGVPPPPLLRPAGGFAAAPPPPPPGYVLKKYVGSAAGSGAAAGLAEGAEGASRRRSASLRPLLPVIIGAVVAIGGGLLAFWLLLARGGSTSLYLAAQAPADALFVAAVSRPAKSLSEAERHADELVAGDPRVKAPWDAARGVAAAVLGFDPFKPSEWAAAGFDLAQPLALSVLALDPELRQPSGAVLSLGVLDAKAAWATVGRLAEKAGQELRDDSGGTPKLALVGSQLAVALQGRRLFLALGPATADKAKMLRTFFLRATAAPLNRTEDYRAAVQFLAPASDVSGFLNLRGLLLGLAGSEPAPLARDFLALAFSGDENETSVYLLLDAQSTLLPYLRPGSPCGEFLGQLDPPLGVVTLSLSDAGGLLKQLGEQAGLGPLLSQLEAELKKNAGTTLEDLSESLRGGCLGVAIYSSEDPLVPFQWLAFAALDSRDKALEVLERGWKSRTGVEKKELSQGDNVLYVSSRDEGLSGGCVGNYLVVGTAVARMENLASGKGQGWLPRQDPGMLYGELNLAELARSLALSGAPQAQELARRIRPDARASLAVARQGNGLLLKYGMSAGAEDALPLARLAAAAAPKAFRSARAANEEAAVAACRAYVAAQDVYRRTDWDGDGVLAYAQSIRGADSLYERKAGAGDLRLLDEAFARAEGNSRAEATPRQGYCFKVLKGQGPLAPGGRKSYLVNGKMALGHALVAYPSPYGEAGRNTFIVSNSGVVYQRDLGANTNAIVEKMTEYDPGAGRWLPVEQ